MVLSFSSSFSFFSPIFYMADSSEKNSSSDYFCADFKGIYLLLILCFNLILFSMFNCFVYFIHE